MEKITIFDKITEFKEKIVNFFQHRKKVRALENYSSVAPFHHRKYLMLIKSCMKNSFLDLQEERFLDHMLSKYQIKYLDWTYQTKWLKKEMRQIAAKRPPQPQILFNFDKQATTPLVIPVQILASKGVIRPMRRI